MADLLGALTRAVRFPGRVRVLGDAELPARGLLLPDGVEWVGIGPRMVLGAACGTALAEASRGGEVVVLGGAGAFAAAGGLPTALGLSNLTVVAYAEDRTGVAPSALARRILGSADEVSWPAVTGATPAPAVAPPAAAWLRRREWPPVQLAILPRSGHCPWPHAATLPLGPRLLEACRFLARHEPALCLAQDEARWSRCPTGPGTLMALAQFASEGRRVVASTTPALLAQSAAELAVISRRGLALKLLCPWPGTVEGVALPELTADGALGRWWVQGSADPSEAELILAQLLGHEDPALLLLGTPGPAPQPASAYPRTQPWTAGSGRWVAEGDDALVICGGARTPAALAACAQLQTHGLAAAVWQCTSLVPLPVVALRDLIGRWRQTHAAGTLLCLDPDGGCLVRALAAPGFEWALPVATGSAQAVALLRAACGR